mgnify:CR=1 FL=1
MSIGKVIQVIGPVVDVEFPPGQLPNIYNALKVTQEENKAAGTPAVRITLEVALHLGENRVRGIAMSTTDGLTRGMDVQDTGAPISVPVGRETLGRLINVLGEPVDEMGPIKTKKPIPFTGLRRASKIRTRRPKSSKPASRSSIFSSRTARAARSASSAVPESARPSSSWSSSTTSPCTTVVSRCSQASVNGLVKATTSGTKCRSRRSSIPRTSPSRKSRWSMAR